MMPGEGAGIGSAKAFSDRISTINLNINKRVQAHKQDENPDTEKTLPRSITWLAAAASVLVFVTAGYILWLQDKNDKAMLAQQHENAKAVITAYGEMPSPPPAQVILTVKSVSYTHLDVYKRQPENG